MKELGASHSYTSAKLQAVSIVLDENTLIAELKLNVKISEVNMSSGNATMMEKGVVASETLANHWGIVIEAVKRTRLVTTQRGGGGG
jgi:hypothetical protein